jgi:glycosyltransferase involved in cell wall biosynthesis
VIPNGVPPLEPSRSRSVIRAELRLRDSDFVALLIANLSPRKRADLFLRAVVAANRSNPQIRGLIVGAGPQSSVVSDLAARTHGVVQLLGARSDVPDLLNAADLLCLTSRSESMPMTILEAMSLGRPVLSTDVGGIRDVVSPGTTGLLVPPEDPGPSITAGLVELAANPSRAMGFGRAGKTRHERLFTADHMIDRYVQALADACKLRPLGRIR